MNALDFWCFVPGLLILLFGHWIFAILWVTGYFAGAFIWFGVQLIRAGDYSRSGRR